jgi:hypothetical protein
MDNVDQKINTRFNEAADKISKVIKDIEETLVLYRNHPMIFVSWKSDSHFCYLGAGLAGNCKKVRLLKIVTNEELEKKEVPGYIKESKIISLNPIIETPLLDRIDDFPYIITAKTVIDEQLSIITRKLNSIHLNNLW